METFNFQTRPPKQPVCGIHQVGNILHRNFSYLEILIVNSLVELAFYRIKTVKWPITKKQSQIED